MVRELTIQNFKSIKELTFSTKRVNVFIGEPNSGKSNILESLSLFAVSETSNLSRLIRYDKLRSLFCDNNIKNNIQIQADQDFAKLSLSGSKGIIEIGNQQGNITFEEIKEEADWRLKVDAPFSVQRVVVQDYFRKYKPYHFTVYTPPADEERPVEYLVPPFGNNLFDVIEASSDLRELVASIVREKGYRLNLDTSRREINMIREEGDVLFTYPYKAFSDTIQRVVFYLAALESNSDSIILLEEPEANTFPFYTKYLAERIGLDENRNQFFITTHNPYLLLSLVEKTVIEDLCVNLVYMENYKTKIKQLNQEELSNVLDLNSDVFFDLDKFLLS